MSAGPDASVIERLDELESRLAFQDDLIESLNEVITRQDRELAQLTLRVKNLSDKLTDLAEAGGGAEHATSHEVPPHY